MAADNPETQGVQTPAPAAVNQELPSVGVARQNFREKVRDFVVAFKNQPEGDEISRGNGKEPIQELENFLANSALPKRGKEKKILEQMQLLQGLFSHLIDLKVKDDLKNNIEAEEAKTKISKCVNEASTAEEEFDKAYEADKQQKRTPPTPGFVTGNPNLYQYTDTNEKTGEKTFGVMSTSNTREGFKDALKHYAESVDEKGNPREFGNVTFGKPTISAQQLKESSGLRKNFFNQICDALDANLYPENEIQKYLEANAGPNMNSRGSYFTDKPNVFSKTFGYETEKEVKDQEMETLIQKIDRFKNQRNEVKEEAGLGQASVNASKQNKNAPDNKPATDNTEAVSLTMKK